MEADADRQRRDSRGRYEAGRGEGRDCWQSRQRHSRQGIDTVIKTGAVWIWAVWSDSWIMVNLYSRVGRMQCRCWPDECFVRRRLPGSPVGCRFASVVWPYRRCEIASSARKRMDCLFSRFSFDCYGLRTQETLIAGGAVHPSIDVRSRTNSIAGASKLLMSSI